MYMHQLYFIFNLSTKQECWFIAFVLSRASLTLLRVNDFMDFMDCHSWMNVCKIIYMYFFYAFKIKDQGMYFYFFFLVLCDCVILFIYHLNKLLVEPSYITWVFFLCQDLSIGTKMFDLGVWLILFYFDRTFNNKYFYISYNFSL
jgi:hypothetical protein